MEEIWFNGKRFTRFGNYWRSSRKFLHRAIWEHHNGSIPKGWHVHHKDGDRDNNEIENLEIKCGKEHLSEHHKGHGRRPEAAMAALPAWRASDAGQRHMHEMGKRNAHHLRTTDKFICERCGTAFVTQKTGGNRFCSNACKSAWRRSAGVDDEARACVVCGAEFSANRYSDTRTCSRSCGRKLWLATPEGRNHLERLADRKRGKK